jgi:hypothetical protein
MIYYQLELRLIEYLLAMMVAKSRLGDEEG